MSLSVYILTGLARKEKASAEAALKYFLLGSFSSAFLLYGFALIYGATGSLSISAIGSVQLPGPLLYAGLGLVIVGFAFKLGLAPFHFWVPDVYQGAPSSITAFMASVVKLAAFGAFLRILFVAIGDLTGDFPNVIWVLAALTMTWGNLAALRQDSVKRMLAYSSIAHAGYALIGFLASSQQQAVSSVVFYITIYALMTVGAFGVVLLASGGREYQYDQDDINALNGLGWQRPFLGLAMTICILSLAGIPPLAGFMAKYYIFSAAIQADKIVLVVIALINSIIALYYYLRVIVALYFSKAESDEVELPSYVSFGSKLAISFAVLGLIYLGLFSDRLYFYIGISAL